MKNIIISVLMLGTFLLGMMAGVGHEQAQVATTTITTGFNATLKADAGKFIAIPACSMAAKCMARLQLCNLTAAGAADSTHCVFISASGRAPYSTPLWIGVSQTTTSSTGVSTIPFEFGTLTLSVPNSELNITP